jgi:acyl-CoA synthetase (AMP-forming)/AMP-acid ligase II
MNYLAGVALADSGDKAGAQQRWQAAIDADISSLRFALVGASPLPKAVSERFESATGVPLMEGYGLTEATCASARSFVDAHVVG